MITYNRANEDRGGQFTFTLPPWVRITYQWSRYLVSIPTGEAIPDELEEVLTMLGMSERHARGAMEIAKRHPGEPQTFIMRRE